MWIYSLGIFFCFGSMIGIYYGSFEKDYENKLLNDEKISIQYVEENKINN